MDPSSNGHDQAAHPHDNPDIRPSGWRGTVPLVLGTCAFLGMALFWIWAFNNRDSIAHPDTFDDPVFVETAEAVCAKRQSIIAGFPLATAVEGPIERGLLIEQGTEQLELMLSELRDLAAPTDPKGADGVAQWLDDYDLYISDRERYTELLANGEDPPFLISGNGQGVRVTDLLTTFAEVNTMASCAPSPDV